MCWNAEVSLQTFVLGCIGLSILYMLSYYKLVLIIIFSIITVQLWEYFIWIYIDKPNISRIFSFIIFIWIFLQPIIVIYSTKYKYLIKYYVSLIISILVFFALFMKLKFDFRPRVAKNGHLDWNWFDNKLLFILLCIVYLVFFLGIMLYTKYYISFVIASVLFVYSVYNYEMYSTFSSMWCWFANLSIIIFIIDALVLKK